MNAVIIFAILSVLLAAGKILRVQIPLLQKLYLPSSVVGGLIGLTVISCWPSLVPADIVKEMRLMPGFLINVIFATLFLGVALPKMQNFAAAVFSQLTLAQIVVWGQYVVGIGLCGFLLMPLFGVHPAFGNLLELGFEGGHGTVGGMSQAFTAKNWSDGIALGYTVATVGMIAGIVLGMVLVNWAYRRGLVKTVRPFSKRSVAERRGIHARDARPSAGKQTVAADSVDSLAWHIAIVGISVLIGWGIWLLVPLQGFPLFPLCMIGGVLLQVGTKLLKVDLLIDRTQMERISGAALDFLALSAIATIQLSVVVANWMPLTIMIVGGIVWTVFAVLFFGPRLFKEAWFERSIAEFGQATGVTATGLLLLRTVDPESKTPASASFAGKQLLHEPAMNLWVALAFALIFTIGWLKVFLICTAMLTVWLVVSVFIMRARRVRPLVILLLSFFALQSASAAWKPVPCPGSGSTLMTEWGEKVTPENAWREYPRPQMVRDEWTNLNGLWEYAITSNAVYTSVSPWDESEPCRELVQTGEILVPFAIETPLSGVGRLMAPSEFLWYRRTITVRKPAGKRILLNFGAVDFRCQVFIGHNEVTDVPHEGGLVPFSADITDFVKEGENELVVLVWDPTYGIGAKGKQVFEPAGCNYTRMSGIWQTVWMETVPEAHVCGTRVTSDVDRREVTIDVAVERPGERLSVEFLDGLLVDSPAIVPSAKGYRVTAKLRNARLWSPESPNLYRYRLTYGDDKVTGYFGLRKFEKRRDANGTWRFYLNDEPYFILGPLDQGWWPDGFLTPPSEAAMAFDIGTLKKLGCNMMRKHMKDEPARYYYLCDKLGLLVVQDMAAGGGERNLRYGFFRREFKEMVDYLYNFPSIVMWCPFNEDWGCQPGEFLTHNTLDWIRRYDPTRLVNGPSGWNDYEGGDFRLPGGKVVRGASKHKPEPQCEAADAIDMHIYRGPGMHPLNDRRVSFLGEFGGLGHAVKGHQWNETKSWGYGGTGDTSSAKGVEKVYLQLMDSLATLAYQGLGGSVYTQTTDVELEINGYLTYDRKVLKFDADKLRAAHERVLRQAKLGATRTREGDLAPSRPLAENPIGVFDSGIGGLSVLELLLTVDRVDNVTGKPGADGKPDLAAEDFVYFGDQANMPYGRYDAEGKADFLRELVVRDAKFVLGGDGHAPSKIVVIACNTATAYGLETLKAMPRPHGAKVIGVVNAGVEAALDAMIGEKEPYAIAVMATPGTISSGVYERTIRAELKGRGVTVPVEVANRGGIGLAEAVENREPGMESCARTNLVALVETYRARGGKAPIKAMILGCTHYPFVIDTFKATFAELRKDPKYAPLLPEDLVFVDPSVYTAVACYRELAKDGLLKPASAPHAAKRVNAFISVGKDGPLPDAVKYGRACGLSDIGTKVVPLTKDAVSKDVADGIGKSFPACRRELGL